MHLLAACGKLVGIETCVRSRAAKRHLTSETEAEMQRSATSRRELAADDVASRDVEAGVDVPAPMC